MDKPRYLRRDPLRDAAKRNIAASRALIAWLHAREQSAEPTSGDIAHALSLISQLDSTTEALSRVVYAASHPTPSETR